MEEVVKVGVAAVVEEVVKVGVAAVVEVAWVDLVREPEWVQEMLVVGLVPLEMHREVVVPIIQPNKKRNLKCKE